MKGSKGFRWGEGEEVEELIKDSSSFMCTSMFHLCEAECFRIPDVSHVFKGTYYTTRCEWD